MKYRAANSIISITLGFGIVSSAFAEGIYATKATFSTAIAGRTLSTKTKAGKDFVAVYDSKGKGTFTLGDNKPAKFTWTYNGDTLCSNFKSINFSECNKVKIVSTTEVEFIDAKSGKLNNNYSIK